jgi:phosphoribosylaminoimidazole-succinocarboxamide synthase
MSVVVNTSLPLSQFGRGKVRDTYLIGPHLLIVASDRLSAFDVVLPDGIPDKGRVLNQISAFWFELTSGIVPNHVIRVVDRLSDLAEFTPDRRQLPAYLERRSMVVRKAERLPVECVVRGYISGSAWSEYRKQGTINGRPMPKGWVESQLLPEPLFTPTTKADAGHDLPLTADGLIKLVGRDIARQLEEKTLAVYRFARDYAAKRGIIIADTKLEFGLVGGKLILIDELLTPDSSRFWDAALYAPGSSPPSYDKQGVRDWLTASGWNKEPPAPALPAEVVRETTKRYREAYARLTGKQLEN